MSRANNGTANLTVRSEDGHYPIGKYGCWHGGIHCTSSDGAVQPLFDGTIVAFKIQKNYAVSKYLSPICASEYQGLRESEKELYKKNPRNLYELADDKKPLERTYSTSYVLMEHRLKLDARKGIGRETIEIIFYTLYMHLLPTNCYDKDKKIPFYGKAITGQGLTVDMARFDGNPERCTLKPGSPEVFLTKGSILGYTGDYDTLKGFCHVEVFLLDDEMVTGKLFATKKKYEYNRYELMHGATLAKKPDTTPFYFPERSEWRIGETRNILGETYVQIELTKLFMFAPDDKGDKKDNKRAIRGAKEVFIDYIDIKKAKIPPGFGLYKGLFDKIDKNKSFEQGGRTTEGYFGIELSAYAGVNFSDFRVLVKKTDMDGIAINKGAIVEGQWLTIKDFDDYKGKANQDAILVTNTKNVLAYSVKGLLHENAGTFIPSADDRVLFEDEMNDCKENIGYFEFAVKGTTYYILKMDLNGGFVQKENLLDFARYFRYEKQEDTSGNDIYCDSFIVKHISSNFFPTEKIVCKFPMEWNAELYELCGDPHCGSCGTLNSKKCNYFPQQMKKARLETRFAPRIAAMMKNSDIWNEVPLLKKKHPAKEIWHFHPLTFKEHIEKFMRAKKEFNPYYGKTFGKRKLRAVSNNPGFAPVSTTGKTDYVHNNTYFATINGAFNDDYSEQHPEYEYFYHEGVDFKGTLDTAVISFIEAKVLNVGWFTSYGRVVVLANLKDKGIYLLAHLSKKSEGYLTEGQIVYPGDTVAFVGGSAIIEEEKIESHWRIHLHVGYYDHQYNNDEKYFSKTNNRLFYATKEVDLRGRIRNPFLHTDGWDGSKKASL